MSDVIQLNDPASVLILVISILATAIIIKFLLQILKTKHPKPQVDQLVFPIYFQAKKGSHFGLVLTYVLGVLILGAVLGLIVYVILSVTRSVENDTVAAHIGFMVSIVSAIGLYLGLDRKKEHELLTRGQKVVNDVAFFGDKIVLRKNLVLSVFAGTSIPDILDMLKRGHEPPEEKIEISWDQIRSVSIKYIGRRRKYYCIAVGEKELIISVDLLKCKKSDFFAPFFKMGKRVNFK